MTENSPNAERETPNAKPIRVLIVDDSSFMQKSLTHILESDSSIKVIDTASEGEAAIRKTKQLQPDVVLLDIAMPVMDGLTALTHIMSECPTPVLVLSGLQKKDARIAIKSLEHGAIDFIPKPSGPISYDIDTIAEEIINKVKTAAAAQIKKMVMPRTEAHAETLLPKPEAHRELVVIGASTGGPRALVNVLSSLPRSIPAAILLVQHMATEFIISFAERLRWVSQLDVLIATEGAFIMPGQVMIAPGNCHIVIERSGRRLKTHLKNIPSPHGVEHSVDYAMESAAASCKTAAMGVLLTGMGTDGAAGMKAIHEAGGYTIAEDETTAVVFGMPKAAIELGCVDETAPLQNIAAAIMRRI